MWHRMVYKKAISNTLFLAKVQQKCSIKYDNNNNNRFKVFKRGRNVLFLKSSNKIFYHDTSNSDFMLATVSAISISTNKDVTLVNTVHKHKRGSPNHPWLEIF